MYIIIKKSLQWCHVESAILPVIQQGEGKNILKWSEEYSYEHDELDLNVSMMEEFWKLA